LSFNGNKIATSGAGGAILTSNKKLAINLRHKSQICKISHPWKYTYDDLGYNLKLPSINAALGLAQLYRLENLLKNKKKIFQIYKKFFLNSNYFRIVEPRRDSVSNYWLNTLLIKKKLSKNKTKIILKLLKNKISVRPAWQLLSDVRYLIKFPKMNLSNSRDLFKRIINIPSGSKVLSKLKK
jgi:perosamine synthetase